MHYFFNDMYYIYEFHMISVCLFAMHNATLCTISIVLLNILTLINFPLLVYIKLFLYCLGFLCLKNVPAQLLPDGYISAFCKLFHSL